METIIHGITQAPNPQIKPVLLDADGKIIVSKMLVYNGQVLQYKTATAITGTNTLDSDTVPSGQLWILSNLVMRYTGTVAGVSMYCNLYNGSIAYVFYSVNPVVTIVDYDRQGQWVLQAGDRVRMTVANGTAGDNIRLWAIGQYMLV